MATRMYISDFQNGVIVTDDYGATETEKWDNTKLGSISVRQTAVSGARVAVTLEADGIAISTDSGASFTRYDNVGGLPSGEIYTCCIVGSDFYVGTQAGIYKSTDDGVSWSVVAGTSGFGYIKALAYFDSVFYLSEEDGGGGGIIKTSDDDFATIDTRVTNSGIHYAASKFRKYGSTVYYGSLDGVHYSSDVTNWSLWTDGGTPFLNGANDVWVNGSLVLVGSGTNSGGDLYKSVNGGTSWTNLDIPAGGYTPEAGADNVWSDGVNIWITTPTGFYKSSDGMTGSTWTQLQTYDRAYQALFVEPDTTKPTPTTTSVQSSPTTETTINMIVTFDEVVTGFTLDDIVVVNGTKGNFAGSNTTTYTFDITSPVVGTITVDVPVDVAQDGAGNNNNAAVQFSIDYELGGLVINGPLAITTNTEWTDATPIVNAEVSVTNSSTLTISGISEWSDVTFGAEGSISLDAGSSLNVIGKTATVVPSTRLKIK